ncbi:MAG: response regulator transcription factor [Anaerolineae bacterium]|nr:response regulator transcription factor [Anaerolineae bacterium]
MKQARILIVDNEPNIRFVLEHTLRHENYIIDMACDGEEAIRLIQNCVYDLLLLDLHMEPVDGMQVLTTLRKNNSDAVVIILTAHGSMESAVEALRLETFDYLLKPATPDIIRKRVREGLERRQRLLKHRQIVNRIEVLKDALDELEDIEEQIPPVRKDKRFLSYGSTVIDHYHREIIVNEKLLDLTSVEFELLSSLIEASPQPVSARSLVKAALGYETEDSEAGEIIKVYIHHLRQKVEPLPSKPAYIKTIRHQGYLWCS